MKRVIIHIGPHKTGTTSLQVAFADERATLGRNGIAYPLFPEQPDWAQHDLGKAVKNGTDQDIAAAWQSLIPIIGDAPTILLSSEILSFGLPAGIAALKAVLDRDLGCPDYEIHAMLRRPADRLISFWHEFARIGWLKDLPSFVRHHLQKPAENHLLDTANQFARWGSVFGMRALHIEPMERALENSNTIVDHAFKEWLGLKDFTSAKQYAANKSLIEHTELIRAIGLMEADSDRTDRHAFAKCITRYLKRHNTDALLASELIASKLVPFSLSDDEPLLREIEERGGHRFSPRPIQSWQYAPDSVFVDRSIERLLLKLHKKAKRRIARRS